MPSHSFIMGMEKISSRKNEYIRRLRLLADSAEYRRERGEFICEGSKTLAEALAFGAEISSVRWRERGEAEGLCVPEEYSAAGELFDYASPMRNSPGPLFTVKMCPADSAAPLRRAIVLESVQDPGNVGTVIRTANAFGIDAVVLTGACAELYAPKTVRATMGAIFRQRVFQVELGGLAAFLESRGLPLYGAALSPAAEDIRAVPVSAAAVAVGSEGKGLSAELLSVCAGQLIIPMQPDSESLNAAVAAAVIMWEMAR